MCWSWKEDYKEEDQVRDLASQNKSKVVGKGWWPMEVKASGMTTAQRNGVQGEH